MPGGGLIQVPGGEGTLSEVSEVCLIPVTQDNKECQSSAQGLQPRGTLQDGRHVCRVRIINRASVR